MNAQVEAQLSSSPKKPTLDTAGLADIFPYYAGFYFDWARDLLGGFDPTRRLIVLDPWNGSGTTTLAAQHANHRSIGVDLNPVANIVATLRTDTMTGSDYFKISPPANYDVPFAETDPLLIWFTPETARRLRQWSTFITREYPESVALGFVALFRVVRGTTKKFAGTNPTWVKGASSRDQLVSHAVGFLDAMIEHETHFLQERCRSLEPRRERPLIIEGSSSSLPIASQTIDITLTSFATTLESCREIAVFPIERNYPQPPLDGKTLRPEHFERLWAIYSLPGYAFPRSTWNASLAKLALARNDLAHGNLAFYEIFQQAGRSVADIERYVNDIEGFTNHFIDSWWEYINDEGYLRH
jgi:hypothetical protein